MDMKNGPKREEEEDSVSTHLKTIERRFETIETSLRRLERRNEEREAAILVLGCVLGGLLSIVVNLWTDYFILLIDPSKEALFLTVVISTVLLIGVFAYLWRWASARISHAPS